MLDYMVLYQSETGNTKKVATTIFSSLPGMSKDLRSLDELSDIPEAGTYFIGFCVHRGTCSLEVGNLLSSLSLKNVALFGTCGAANLENYYKNIENSARIWLEDDNRYLGGFFCQGKMPLQVRQRYESMLTGNEKHDYHLKMQLLNFDEAMIHPTKEDLQMASRFVTTCLEKLDNTSQTQ
nr:flavodoxin family protein [uncultured Sellimonas sp.]